MAFFRQYIAPLFIFAIFFVALAAVSARIFLPSDMAGPAVMDEPVSNVSTAPPALLPQAWLSQTRLSQTRLSRTWLPLR